MFFLGKNKNQKSGKKGDVSLDVIDHRSSEGHCFISGNVRITGEVQFGGTLRIDGRVDGKISVYSGKRGTLILSKGAFVDGPVDATDMITDGTVHGDVTVQNRLECRGNSVIKGEMHYGSIQIAEGAQLIGRCVQREKNKANLSEVGQKPSLSLATRDVVTMRKNG